MYAHQEICCHLIAIFYSCVDVIWMFQETHQWNGITSKKKGQKWGKERTSSRRQDVYEHSSQERPTVQNVEKQHASNTIDFDKLTPYTSLPKVCFYPSSYCAMPMSHPAKQMRSN